MKDYKQQLLKGRLLIFILIGALFGALGGWLFR